MRSHLLAVLARLLAAAFAMLSAIYCLLAYLPFTYHQVHLGGLLPWLTVFARIHPYLYWLAFAAAALSLPDLRNDRSRPWTVLFLFVSGALGVRLSLHPFLSNLDDEIYCLIGCVVALMALLGLGTLDWLAQRETLAEVTSESIETTRLFRASMATAAYVCAVSAMVVFFTHTGTAGLNRGMRGWLLVVAASMVFHLTVFLAVFLALNFTGALARVLSKNLATTMLLYAGLVSGIVALVLKSVVFAPLSFTGWTANGIAFLMACGILSVVTGLSVRVYRPEHGPIESPMALLLAPFAGLRASSGRVRTGVLLLASVLAGWALVRTAKFDWEYMIQTLILVAVWVLAFAFFYTVTPANEHRRSELLVIFASTVLCFYLIFSVLESNSQTRIGNRLASIHESLEQYADYDVGFRLAHRVLSPQKTSAGDEVLYSFLAGNTNIPRSVRTDPVDINLAGRLTPTSGPKPNIFVFVIDSLRRDYLSAYNPSVTFAPEIGVFARESSVARNAFTRYAGTGLSEPSIWAGAMLLHKQYVTPFHPMNSLEKLLAVDGYREFITKDEILSTILSPSASRIELDAGVSTMNCELCRSLAELEAKIIETKAEPGPIFVYTQPQDIHISVINRTGRSSPAGEDYAGFDAPYASRIARMDKCFGQFVRFLKEQNLFDNSIVILTSDHGDSLGERGRWGHAYTVVPEVVRIPLIIHLPATMRSLAFDPDSTAFLTDITPSLYYLLGHRPIEPNRIFGRPLFTQSAQEASAYARDSYLIASSYAPVYGLLAGDGRSLYVVDGVTYKDSFYQWDGGQPVSSPAVTPELRVGNQQRIRDYVAEISRFYHFAGPTAPN